MRKVVPSVRNLAFLYKTPSPIVTRHREAHRIPARQIIVIAWLIINNKSSSMKHFLRTFPKLATWIAALLVGTSTAAFAQADGRRPRQAHTSLSAPRILNIEQGTEKTAYGVVGFDNSHVGYVNSLVSFPFADATRLTQLASFGDYEHNVTAAAYAKGYYYVERTVMDGTVEVPSDLVRYDIDNGELATVGTLTGFTSHFNDMTYDYADGKMYVISTPYSTYSVLYTLDTETAASEKVADLDRRFFTLACTYTGQLFGISFEGDLCKIDKHTGEVTLVGATGYHPTYFQSMEFDHSDGTLYWASSLGDADTEGGLTRVDTLTGKAEIIGSIGDGAQIAGLYIPFSAAQPAAPAAVGNFRAVPGNEGTYSATLTWVNPSKSFGGDDLTSLSEVIVCRNKEVVKRFTDVQPGQSMEFTDTPEENTNAYYTYSVVAVNEHGEGAESKQRIFVGRELPQSPQTVTLQTEGYDTALLSWQMPERGLQGGYVDHASLTYTVVRQPDGKVIAEGLTDTHVSDGPITPARQYYYTIQAHNRDGESPTAYSDTLVLGPAYAMPFHYDFTATDAPDTWTVLDADGDGYTWLWAQGYTGITMAHQPSNSSASDDWLISYYMPFTEGDRYRITLRLRASGSDKLGLYLLDGTDTDTPAQTIEELDFNGAQGEQQITVSFESEVSGDHRLALRALSPLRANWLYLSSVDVKKAEQVNLAATQLTGETRPVAGNAYTYTATVANYGAQAVPSYSVVLKNAEGSELARATAGAIEVGETAEVPIEWTPAEGGLQRIVAEVSCPGDELASDNLTDTLQVDVRNAYNGTVREIGTSATSRGNNSPFNFFDQHAAALNLYSSDEVDTGESYITNIAWPYDATSQYDDVEAAPIKVYLANTERTSTADGWIPEAEMTLVYDGTINLTARSQGEISLRLEEPFVYTGGNLAVLTTLDCATYYPYIYFTQYKSPLEGNSTYLWSDYRGSAFDFSQSGHQDWYGQHSAVILYLSADKAAAISTPMASRAFAAYSVYDLQGRLVASGRTDAEGHVSTAALPQGIYVVSLHGSGPAQSFKISVSK